MYAHVDELGVVDDVRSVPPDKVWDGAEGRWWDLRGLDPITMAAASWYPVVTAAKPADTATHTHDPSYAFNGSDSVIQSWVQRAKTSEELAQETAQTNYNDLVAKAAAALTNNQTAISELQTAVSTLNSLSTATWNNQTQRDNALRSNSAQSAIVAQHAIALTRQNNALIRVVTGLLDSQAGT